MSMSVSKIFLSVVKIELLPRMSYILFIGTLLSLFFFLVLYDLLLHIFV